jgi:hypothetical protein
MPAIEAEALLRLIGSARADDPRDPEIVQGRNVLLINKQNPIRFQTPTKIRYFSDRLLGADRQKEIGHNYQIHSSR